MTEHSTSQPATKSAEKVHTAAGAAGVGAVIMALCWIFVLPRVEHAYAAHQTTFEKLCADAYVAHLKGDLSAQPAPPAVRWLSFLAPFSGDCRRFDPNSRSGKMAVTTAQIHWLPRTARVIPLDEVLGPSAARQGAPPSPSTSLGMTWKAPGAYRDGSPLPAPNAAWPAQQPAPQVQPATVDCAGLSDRIRQLMGDMFNAGIATQTVTNEVVTVYARFMQGGCPAARYGVPVSENTQQSLKDERGNVVATYYLTQNNVLKVAISSNFEVRLNRNGSVNVTLQNPNDTNDPMTVDSPPTGAN